MEEEQGGEGGAQRSVGNVVSDVVENRAMAWLTVAQVGHGDAIEVLEAMSAGMVAVIGAVLTVQAQVPFSCEENMQKKTCMLFICIANDSFLVLVSKYRCLEAKQKCFACSLKKHKGIHGF